MRDLDLKSLRLFVAVCDHGNIKAAAAQEHIEPSAISKRLAQLEDAVGQPLLLRGRQGARPTPAGQALLEHARGLQFALARIDSDMAAFRGSIRGQVRLAASVSAIAEALLDDIAGFMREPQHQDIKVDIEERISRDIVGLVRDGVVPLGICWDRIDFGGLATLPYRGDELVLAVPGGHALAGRANVRLAEALDHPHVGLPPTTAVHSMLHREAAALGRSFNYRVVVSSFDAALRVVGAGLGVSVVPREVSAPHTLDGRVRLVPLNEPWAQRRFAICFRRREDLSVAAGRLVDHLCRQAASIPIG